jgi:hypothetical protein
MEEYEADDALASAAFLSGQDKRVGRVVISTPDKDLAQCVQGTRIVQFDRRRRIERDSEAVVAKFGVEPKSIPDYLAMVGDAADGYPGLRGWGAKSPAAVLSRFGSLEGIPVNARGWHVNVPNPQALSEVFNENRTLAFHFRDLATLRTHLPVFTSVDDLLWRGATPAFATLAERLDKAKFSNGAYRGRRGQPTLSPFTHYIVRQQKHVAAGRRGKPSGPIDFELEKLGLSRTIGLWVPTFLPALVAAATSDLVAAVPQYFVPTAISLFGLHVFHIPLKLERVTILQAWHPRFDVDPAHRLLRDCTRQAFHESIGRHVEAASRG